MEKKTASYTRAAVDRYREKNDTLHINFKKEYNIRVRLAAAGVTKISDYVSSLVLADLEKRESAAAPGPEVSEKCPFE